MSSYVLICIYDAYTKDIIMVEKKKPEWQKGLYNLVGGKIEDGETPREAAYRETEEETGITNTILHNCGSIKYEGGEIHCFYGGVLGEKIRPQEGEVERVFWTPFYAVNNDPKLIGNLRVMIPLMLNGVTGWTFEENNVSGRTNDYKISFAS